MNDLKSIPGVGKSIAQDFYNIGIKNISDLIGQDPENLYDKICFFQNSRVDRCILYVCRCAVYFAENETNNLDPEKLKWWNWKNST